MRERTNAERMQDERIADLVKRRDGYANLIARMTTKRERIPVSIRKEYKRLDTIVMVEGMVRVMMGEEITRNAAGYNRG